MKKILFGDKMDKKKKIVIIIAAIILAIILSIVGFLFIIISDKYNK